MQTFLPNLTSFFANVALNTNCLDDSSITSQQIWNYLTDALVLIAILTAIGFACLALKQWVTRKKFTKIDRELRWSILPLSLMALTYLIFEKIWIISYRPLESGKPWEPSFPSTHTMLTATIFFITIIILPKYLKNRTARIILDLLMLIAIILVAVGRVLAHMHWPTDVLGGILFSAIFAVIYALILRIPPEVLSKPIKFPSLHKDSSDDPTPPKIIHPDSKA